MRKRIYTLLFVALSGFGLMQAQTTASYEVVPQPRLVEQAKGGSFQLSAQTRVVVPKGHAELARSARMFAEWAAHATGIHLAVAEGKAQAGDIVLAIDAKVPHAEGYELRVSPRQVVVAGRTPAGVFYGLQTLRKALPASASATVALPAATIKDEPRFAYRGMHLDCSRHFFTTDFVKKYIDILALHHVNRFHWHLTDDQGWRLEIRKYPRLTTEGAWRTGTILGRNSDIDDGQRYGGFYTQEEAREIVRYAAERYITVIPEIDMPGHMVAALTAYPELGCTGGPYRVGHNWGVYNDILCVGKPQTLAFVRDVLDEVMDIFPSEYIHIGGDEAPRLRWEQCPRCQQRIADEHLAQEGNQSGEAMLQGWFTTQVERYLGEHGRRIIGWDEILECGVSPSTTIMSWQGVEPGLKAVAEGHDVIMSPMAYCYLNFYPTDSIDFEPLSIGGNVPVRKVYDFEPAPDSLTTAQRAHIVGVQANLWSEYLVCSDLAEYQLLPRLAALSEVQWTQPAQKDYQRFMERLGRLRLIYDSYGWKYGRHAWPEEFKRIERYVF